MTITIIKQLFEVCKSEKNKMGKLKKHNLYTFTNTKTSLTDLLGNIC